jgi:endonuclease/exonuclease/phosphatase family metal-dependent hydrolase
MDTPRGSYGNALMSRLEPSSVECIDLGGIEPRGAIRFRLKLPGGPADICATHLGLTAAERLRQLRQLDGILFGAGSREEDNLQVLMGDLNEWRPSTRFIRALRRRFPRVSRQNTFPARWPAAPLDRIAVRGPVGEVRFRRLDQPPADRASDHRPLLADVDPREDGIGAVRLRG